MNKETVLIYRDNLLPPSETFIKAQAENLSVFQTYYVGAKRFGTNSILDNNKTMVINNGSRVGRIREILYKLSGLSLGMQNQLLKLDPKLIHAHFGPDGIMASKFAKKLGIPLIVTFHGYDATIKDDQARGYFHKNYVKRRDELVNDANVLIAVSNFIKKKMIEQGFPEHKIVQHYIGIDTEFFTHDPIVKREKIVLFVGRLVEKKGVEYLIKALSKIQKWDKEIKLIIIGEGPLRRELEKTAQELLLNYKFLGAQNPLTIKNWLNKSKVFCVPSVTAENGDAEGFGMVFAEANSMGVPVVSFDSGGISEAVSHGETGFLAPEKDIDILASYIKTLFKDEELWSEFSKNGIERVRSLYNLKENTKGLEEIYKKILR